ncbi:hypothetical protein K523DRAFT_322368 [Schizophyllum commune Tattone D]|nr:hypothetical protein K523DRAFT_322368 [Schizophyllum commune Tattone D]
MFGLFCTTWSRRVRRVFYHEERLSKASGSPRGKEHTVKKYNGEDVWYGGS